MPGCRGRIVAGRLDGTLCAPLVAFRHPVSLYGELEGMDLNGRIVYAPSTRGSTVAPYILYRMWRRGTAPAAILVSTRAEPMLVAGAVLTGVILVDNVDCSLEGSSCVCLKHVSEREALIEGCDETGTESL